MKKVIIIMVSLGAFMLILFVTARLTHVIDTYSIPSDSNAPTYMPGDKIIASRLIKPGNGKFLCFEKPGEKNIWLFRCIGRAGDIIEIKNGEVYLNGSLLNEPYCWNEYIISEKQLSRIRGYIEQYKYPLYQLNDSLSVITMSPNDLVKYQMDLKPFIKKKGEVTHEIFPEFAMLRYNEDSFGPVKVPDGSYFLMGDNRHSAQDSRFIGFIKESQVVSTVLNN